MTELSSQAVTLEGSEEMTLKPKREGRYCRLRTQ